MEEIAERGFAAHWKYKSTDAEGRDEGEFDRWIKQVREALNSPTENAVEFLDNFKLSLYTNEIVVFTPKGESRTLPRERRPWILPTTFIPISVTVPSGRKTTIKTNPDFYTDPERRPD